MRLRYVATVNPSVPELARGSAHREVSFLPLDRIWADDRFDPSGTIMFNGDPQSYNPFCEGDLLVPKVAPTFTQARVAIANGLGLATSEVFVVRSHEVHATRFLKYRLMAADFLSEGEASWTGVAGLKRISAAFVRDVRISSRAWEQRRQIADFLDRECARIDDLNNELREYGRDLVRPAIEAFRRFIDGLPWGRIGYQFEVQLGKMLDEKRIDRQDVSSYLRNANVHWDRLALEDVKQMTFTTTEKQKFRLQPGDLLVCEGGEPGRAAVWNGEIDDCYFQKALHRVRPLSDASVRYLLWCLRDLSEQSAFRGDGPGRYTHLTAEQLRAVRIPMPDAETQAHVAETVDGQANAARDLERATSALARQIIEYRNALITEAVTGQLDVTRLSEAQLDESLEAVRQGEQPEVLAS